MVAAIPAQNSIRVLDRNGMQVLQVRCTTVHSVHLPKVIANFPPVSKHDDAARGETEEVFDAVLADDGVQVHAVHVQPLDPLEVRHLSGGRRHVAVAAHRGGGGGPQSRMGSFHLKCYTF